MELSIIIVNYGSGRLAKACVDSIRRSPPQVNYEVLVVDNSSPDDSQELLATEVPGIRFLPQEANLGYSKAVNLAIKEANGKFILILNPDIIVLNDAIDAMLDFAREHPKAAVVAGQLLNPNGSIQESSFRFYTPFTILARRTPLRLLPGARRHLDEVLLHKKDKSKAFPIDWALGACLLVRREAIEKVGVMDERYFLYFEDMDWCRRFWEAGYEVWYIPTARFAHYYKRESAHENWLLSLLQPITRTHIVSGIKYFWKYRNEGMLPRRHSGRSTA